LAAFAPTLVEAARQLKLAIEDLDAGFGVVAVDLEAEPVSVPIGGGPWVGDVVGE